MIILLAGCAIGLAYLLAVLCAYEWMISVVPMWIHRAVSAISCFGMVIGVVLVAFKLC